MARFVRLFWNEWVVLLYIPTAIYLTHRLEEVNYIIGFTGQCMSLLGILVIGFHFALTAPGGNGGDLLTPEGELRKNLSGFLILIMAPLATAVWFYFKIIARYS